MKSKKTFKITKKTLKIIGIKMAVALIILAIELLVILIMEKGNLRFMVVKPSDLLPFVVVFISNFVVQYGINYEDFIDCKPCEKSSAVR